MLEGLEVSVVNSNSLEGLRLRLDSGFYQKRLLLLDKALRDFGSTNVEDIGGKIDCSAFYPSIVEFYDFENKGVPFIRVSEIDNGLVKFTDGTAFIPNYLIEQNSKTIAKALPGDIVIAKGGNTLAKVGLLSHEYLEYATSRDLIVLRTQEISYFESHFIWMFLHSSYGQDLLLRTASQTGQPHLTIEGILELPIPRFSVNFQKTFKVFYEQSIELMERGKALYREAETLLLTELGIENWQPTTETVEVKSFADSFGSSGRLDAEYYQPRFDELERILWSTKKAVTLGSIITSCQRGSQPEYLEENGIVVLNSKHIRENKIEFTDNRVATKVGVRPDSLIRQGDVLVNGTGVGTIGRAAAYMLDEPALPDNHVTILRSSKIDPYFLALQLNSIIGKLQVDKYFKGSSGQIELYPDDIREFVIWEAPGEIQQKIRAAIEAAQQQSSQSSQLLDIAKRAVELAIETSEAEALTWLNEQTSRP